MPQFPVRALAERGLVLDVPPFELGPTGFSDGSNVRFRDGAVRRASVLRVTRTFAKPKTRAVLALTQSSGFDRLFAADNEGAIFEVATNNTLTDVSVSGWSAIASNDQWTSVVLGDVLYANKPTHRPCYIDAALADFAVLPGWPTDNRARALGASRDQLFAVNLTKGINPFPNTVAISDFTLYGQPPATWDPLAVGSMANEITIAGARTPLVGCLDLDGTMIVYGERQSWRFVFTGDTSAAGQNLWVNEPLSIDRGMVSPNAAAYLERKHYVFGADDLYVHDGVTVQSIADGKIRRWVFRNLLTEFADRCFVTTDPNTDEVLFAFPSKDGGATWSAGVGCNRGVVFDTRRGTWTKVDLPDVTSASAANYSPTSLWTDATSPWLTFGGTWSDLADGFLRSATLVTVQGGSSCRFLALDEANTGTVSFEAPASLNPTAFVERVGFDLDELGAPLQAYKTISALFPQVTVLASQTTVRFRVGASMTPQGPYEWSDWRTFDPATDYQINYRLGGRYLGLRLEMLSPVDFEWSGLDVDVKPGGRR